jgi:hypothetical protein
MFGFIKKLFGLPTEAEKVAAAENTQPQRAKSADGKFVADNPSTPVNEAWKDGKAPAKKAKKPAQKPAPKAKAAPKPKADPAAKKKPAKAPKPTA